MIRILFVDDDTNVLAGLRRSMHPMRQEWEMEFIDDPEVAITTFSEGCFDVVVSDMRMPKVDGAELLESIKKISPESIRIILSGHSDPALIMKSVGQTHQYLTKPCESDELKRTIERTYSLKKLVSNPNISQLIGGVDELPSIPAIYQKIVDRLQDADASVTDIAKIVQEDIGMTTKILQLVNSAFFGLPKRVSSIDKAVSYLGLDTIGALVLGHGVFSQYEHLEQPGGFHIDALWNYCSRCSSAAKIIAGTEGMSTNASEEAFLGSLLHDVGKLVLASVKPEAYAEVLKRADAHSSCTNEIELEVLGTTHSEVGAYLIGLWGLPDTIVEAVAYHEKPSVCQDDSLSAAGVTHLASQLAFNPLAEDPADPTLCVDMDYLDRIGIADRWSVWRTAYLEELEQDE